MPRVAIATPSMLAAEAGADVAAQGGNAVDAAIAAALIAMISEPGICALGGGGFVTIGMADSDPITIDGNAAMPGLGRPPAGFGDGGLVAEMEYGGGVRTRVGYESVAVPGGLAALGAASQAYGEVPWPTVVAPAIEAAESGFALSAAAAEYLDHSHQVVFGWDPVSHRAVHRDDGTAKRQGDLVHLDGLAGSLQEIADQGAATLYTGDLAAAIVEDFSRHGGLITARDLREYQPEVRRSVSCEVGTWSIFANPPPSIGGPVLLAMLEIAAAKGGGPEAIAKAQQAAMRYRRDRLDLAEDLTEATAALMQIVSAGDVERWIGAPSTIHVSAADAAGNACAITMSAGYGSGVIPAGTGIWMNNSLGEEELNRRGFHSAKPGARLPSNMAPTVARSEDGSVLAIGSPGADRITTAIQQVILGFALDGRSLQEAVDSPRLHVEFEGTRVRIAYEAGAGAETVGLPTRPYPDLHMYFGGVTAAGWGPHAGLIAVADPRRTGGTAIR